MELYDLQLQIEELVDGGDYSYIAVSPELPSLLVAGDSVEEVLAIAPQVASALIASMKAAGDALPANLRTIPSVPFASRLLVTA